MGKGGGQTPQTPTHLGPMLKKEQTFIQDYVRFHPFNFASSKIQYEDKSFNETGVVGTEPSVFNVFTIPC
jgi:hypothetical protein